MNSTNRLDLELLDVEWVDLILSARKIGLSPGDIREFLASPIQPEKKTMYMNIENERYMFE